MSTLLSEGAFVLDVDGHYVAPAADGILKFASIAKLRRSQPWGRSRVFRRHGATAHILHDRQSPTALEGAHGSGSSSADEQALSSPAYYPLDDDRFPAGEDLSVLVHAVGVPPHSILVPYAASADTVCQVATYALAAQLPASAPGRCRWRPCSVTPVGEHALHSVFVVGELEAQAESHVVLDLRAARVTGPDFHSMVFPSTLSVELLFRLLTTFLGGQRPVAIFHGITPVSGYFCTLASGDMLRPVSACVTSAQVHLSPAMWRTPDCMEAMPGLRVASMAARVPAARGNDPQVATTHTTSMAPALGSTTTTTVAARASVAHNDPWTGAQRLTLHVHIVGDNLAVAHTTLNGRGLVVDALAVLLWCLHQNGALSVGATVTACPRVFFDTCNRPHIFISARLPGSMRPMWLFAPEWDGAPFCIPWTAQLEIPDVLDQLHLGMQDVLYISVNGEVCRDHPAFTAPGHVVLAASAVHGHFTLPLHMLADRFVGVQSLLFRARGPNGAHLASRSALHLFCHQLVEHARSLLGERNQGNRFVIAGMCAPPLLCCAGTPLPPSIGQAQRFYDDHLQPHFGAMCLRDTACVEYDITLFVQRQDSVDRRIWLLPMEGGMDAIFGDIDGQCLQHVASPIGYRLVPSVRSGWVGISRWQHATLPVEEPWTNVVRTPPGLSSSSGDDCEPTPNDRAAQPRTLTAEEDAVLARWSRRNQRLRDPASSSSAAEASAGTGRDPVPVPSDTDSQTSHSEPGDADGHSLLQVTAARRPACRQDAPLRIPLQSTLSTPCMQVLTAAGILPLRTHSGSTYEDVTAQLATNGCTATAGDLVPLCPAPIDGPSLLVRSPNANTVTVAVWHSCANTFRVVTFAADIQGRDVPQACGYLHDLHYCGRPAQLLPAFFHGMVLETSLPSGDDGPETTPAASTHMCGQGGARLPDAPTFLCEDDVTLIEDVASPARPVLDLDSLVATHLSRPHNAGVCYDMVNPVLTAFV